MKVSVCMITYNHESFIAQAIESVMAQETDFDFELVIGEDYSTDQTRQICVTYKERYPDRIRLLLPNSNIGMTQNFIQTLQACDGEYVALLEGDDYWTNSSKLQRQVDFLDMHPSYSECATNAEKLDSLNGKIIGHCCANDLPNTLDLEAMLASCWVPTCSVMLRNGIIGDWPHCFSGLFACDWPLHILQTERGPIGYINESMAIYRIHSGGVWSGLNQIKQLEANMKARTQFNSYLNLRHDKIIKPMLSRDCYEIAKAYHNINDVDQAAHWLSKCIRMGLFKRHLRPQDLIKTYLMIHFPPLYSAARVLKLVEKPVHQAAVHIA